MTEEGARAPRSRRRLSHLTTRPRVAVPPSAAAADGASPAVDISAGRSSSSDGVRRRNRRGCAGPSP